MDCAHDIGGRAPDKSYRLILDAVALPVGKLQAAESGDSGWLFAKNGLLVRAGTAVELTVAPGSDALIGWGSPGPVGTTIRVPSCPAAAGWLAFAGGYHVREAACVPLIVRADGREQQAGVSVGAAC